MKNLVFSLMLLMSGFSFSQTFNTGDKDLDASLVSINVQAKTNLTDIKKDWVQAYNTTTAKIDELMKKGMTAADVFMTLEISKITKKPIDVVYKSYETNKKKGWGAIAKDLGIKPGSAEFHALKGSAKKNSDKAKNKGNSKSKPQNKPQNKPKKG